MKRMNITALVLSLSLPTAALAQSDDEDFGTTMNVNAGGGLVPGMNIRIDVNEGSRSKNTANTQVEASAREEIVSDKPGQAFRLVYETGKTAFRILEPEGFRVRLIEDGMQRYVDSIPMSQSVIAGKFYGVEILGPRGEVLFSKKFEARSGMTASLWARVDTAPVVTPVRAVQPEPIVQAAPARASCLGAGDLASIRQAVEGESFSDGKLNVLGTAASERSVCVSEVVQLLALFDFSKDKLTALELLKPGISDLKNAYQVYGAFDFDADKQKAKAILGR